MAKRVGKIVLASVLALSLVGVVANGAQAGSRWPGGGPDGLAGEMYGHVQHYRWPNSFPSAGQKPSATNSQPGVKPSSAQRVITILPNAQRVITILK